MADLVLLQALMAIHISCKKLEEIF